MAHCPYERLADLEDVLAAIRTWGEINEPKPGIFYFRRVPFLHFHVDGDRRWADVRDGADWAASVEIPFAAGVNAKRAFLKTVARCHQAMQAARAGKRAKSARK